MPNFPASSPSFTNKSAGQTIQPAHINDLQDEVVAIGGGYVLGTAPINSSRASVTTLNVAGGSSMATLNVTSGSTFASATVTGGSTLATLQVTNGSTLAGVTVIGTAQLSELTNTPAAPSSGVAFNFYMRNDKAVIQFTRTDATVNYFYLDMTLNAAAWAFSTSAP